MASAQAAAVQAKANQDQSERALRRIKELHTQSPNLISTEQLEQAQTAFDIAEANLNAAQHQVDQARAAVQSARDNLRKTTLVAPMTGRVTRLAVEEGEVAVPSTFSKDIGLLLTVSDLSVIQAKVKVDETEGGCVVKDGVANFGPAKVGVAGDEYFEVSEGLRPGETIVAGPCRAIRDLKEGARLREMKASSDSGLDRSEVRHAVLHH